MEDSASYINGLESSGSSMVSKLDLQHAEPRLSGSALESPASSEEALDAAIIAAISSALPGFVAVGYDDVRPIELRIAVEAEKVCSDLTSESGASFDEPGKYASFRSRYLSNNDSVASFGSDISGYVECLHEQLDGVRQQNERLIEEKLGLLRGRHKEEVQRFEWIKILQHRMSEALQAKDEFAKARDEVILNRQEQYYAAMKDMQTKVASALRQRDEALSDNVSNEERRLREADRYKDEVERLNEEIDDQLRSGDANIGEHLDNLQMQHKRRINNLQNELAAAHEKAQKDEKNFASRVSELEARIKNVDLERVRLQSQVNTATLNVRNAQKEKEAVSRQLEAEQSGRKRDKDGLIKAREEVMAARAESADAIREARANKAAALEAEQLRAEVLESTDKVRRIETDAREQKQQLQDEVDQAKEQIRTLMAETSTRVSQEGYRRVQDELSSIMARTEETRKRHEASIASLKREHEAVTKSITKELAKTKTNSDAAQAKASEEITGLMVERDAVRKALEVERQNIADLESELSTLADKVELFKNMARMRMERERLDKLRQIAKLRQDLTYMGEANAKARMKLQDDISRLKGDMEDMANRSKEVVASLMAENQQLVDARDSIQRAAHETERALADKREQWEAQTRQVILEQTEIKRKDMELEAAEEALQEERDRHAVTAALMRKELENASMASINYERAELTKKEMEASFTKRLEEEQTKVKTLEEVIEQMKLDAMAEGGAEGLREQLNIERQRSEYLVQQIEELGKEAVSCDKTKAKLSSKLKAAAASARIQELERKVDTLQRLKDTREVASTAPTESYLKELEKQLESVQKKFHQSKKREGDLAARVASLTQEVETHVKQSEEAKGRQLEEAQQPASDSPKNEALPLEPPFPLKDVAAPRDGVTNAKGSLPSSKTRDKATSPASSKEDKVTQSASTTPPKKKTSLTRLLQKKGKASSPSRRNQETTSSTGSPSSQPAESPALNMLEGADVVHEQTVQRLLAENEALKKQLEEMQREISNSTRTTAVPPPSVDSYGVGDHVQSASQEPPVAAPALLEPLLKKAMEENCELQETLDEQMKAVNRAAEDIRLLREDLAHERNERSQNISALRKLQAEVHAAEQKAQEYQSENLQLIRSIETEKGLKKVEKTVDGATDGHEPLARKEKELREREDRLSGLSDERKLLFNRVKELNEKLRLLGQSERRHHALCTARANKIQQLTAENKNLSDQVRNLKSSLMRPPLKSSESNDMTEVSTQKSVLNLPYTPNTGWGTTHYSSNSLTPSVLSYPKRGHSAFQVSPHHTKVRSGQRVGVPGTFDSAYSKTVAPYVSLVHVLPSMIPKGH